MQIIQPEEVQKVLDALQGQDLYVHLEMTLGAYAAHHDETKLNASTFIRNALIRYSHGTIAGSGPYRIGLKMEHGWVYSEGLTHWDPSATDRLIAAGHDGLGKLVVAFELSKEPFGKTEQ